MLIEELFERGTMTMGDGKAALSPETLHAMIAGRAAAAAEAFGWIEGEWSHENMVPATRFSPAYTDAGVSRFSISADPGWVVTIAPDGSLHRSITFDPLSRQWIYVLMRGAFGMLRSKTGWVGSSIAFTGLMTMLGMECEWRMTWTRYSEDEFGFVNEQGLPDGGWAYIDEWRFRRLLSR